MPMYIPPEHSLTDTQLEVSYIPLSGRYLITGGPGSGKTTIALYRTMYIKRENPNARIATFLFTRALSDFFADGIQELSVGSQVLTWAKWQRDFLVRHGGWEWHDQMPPWDMLSQIILERFEVEEQYDHLIIDEGQDFKETDLKVMNLLAKNITVFADTNQSIRDLGPEMAQDRLETISRVLSIDEEDSFHLKENHRNTRRIIEAAIPLAPDDVDINLDFIINQGTPPTLAVYKQEASQVDFICRVIKNSQQRDIAVLHLKNQRIRELHDLVGEKLNGSVPLELLRRGRFNFSRPSVKFCTLDSVKGLEFDVVILPNLSRDDYWVDRRNLTRLYVAMTRPRLDLVMIYPDGNGAPAIFDIPPDRFNRINLT
jgi:DNA helicase IV